MTSAAHNDASRAKVPSTNIACAYLRMLESRKPPGERLIVDPFAEKLSGPNVDIGSIISQRFPPGFHVNMMGVRTRWGDDTMSAAMPMQVVILGAGLDAKAWRLEVLRGVPLFEVDFQEVLDAKRSLMEGDRPIADLRQVAADLSAEDWVARLVGAGFVKERPSFWLLEGLTGYLTEAELNLLLGRIASCAAPGSKMAASFTGRGSGQATNMHRFYCQSGGEAAEILGRHGWEAEVRSFWDVSAVYGRTVAPADRGDWEYFLVTARRVAGG